MKTRISFILIFFLSVISTQEVLSQTSLPVIRAKKRNVAIRDGKSFTKHAWNISPEINPDIYIAKNKNSYVTFYTDIDSIRFFVKENQKYDFNIILNKKDTALTEIIYLPTYLETLKRDAKYNDNDNRKFPEFTYQSADDSNLVKLKNAYNLEKIAGKGNEISKILNLCHWIHNTVKHDGIHGNPPNMNALDMLKVCKKEHRGLNCRGMAIALNECYLAMGFQSRYVTCLPKDSLGIDQDCHVINSVYSKTLKKWIWIDPTFDAHVMDENGNLLGIEEVRERLINNLPLEINSDANWNHKSKQTKENYLYNYMAKNLYILECPVKSEYNYETAETGKDIEFIQLVPVNYFNQKKFKNITKGSKRNVIIYKTNNSKKFWEI